MTDPPDLKRISRSRPTDTATRIDRLPPHSPEAESATLGCLLISPESALPESIETLPCGAEEFYDLRHQTIYSAALIMVDAGQHLDILTLQQHLKDRSFLEAVGGLTYLAGLPSLGVPGATAHYAAIVHEKFLLRKMVAACTDAVSRIYEFEGDSDTLIDDTEKQILDVRRFQNISRTPPVKALVGQAIQRIEDSVNRKGGISGLATGFTDLDKMTSGLQPADMIVIAARPSMGKTSLALNIAEYVTIELKEPVGVFSLEMTAQSLITRMICCRARVNLRSISEGFLADRDYPKIVGAAGNIARAPLHIDDSHGLSIMQLRSKARRMHQQFGIKLLVIDYIQLLNAIGNKRRFESRQQEVSDISSGIKSLARELNIPVIAISQLNREIERDKNRRPRLSDLRESGAVEQDADLVSFLYRTKQEDDGYDENHECIAVNLMIAKQRSGPTGDVQLTFLKPYTRFESAARVSGDDIPQETMNYRSQHPD